MNIKTISKLESADTLIIPFYKNDKFKNRLEKAAKVFGLENLNDAFLAETNEVLYVLPAKSDLEKLILLGLGEKPNPAELINIFRKLFVNNKKKFKGEIIIDLEHLPADAEWVANGISLAAYEMGLLKTREEEASTVFNNGAEIKFLLKKEDEKKAKEAINLGLLTAESQMNIMALGDAPSNHKTPEMMADYIVKSGIKNGFEVTVFDEKQCEEKGFHGLLAVGRGSVDRPVRFVVMEYKTAKAKKKIGLVGKGVTFDTGGVSLKPGKGMEDMKLDMGGSAAVIGTMELVAKLKMDVHLIGIVALTENCIDALAIKPGDVINSYSGKTIEVINTDAEGRLILADAIHYMATEFEPEVMIDLATLTGSIIGTLGHTAAGLMTNNDKLAFQLQDAGQKTGEKLWRLPLWDDFRPELDSDVADIKNLGSAYSGAITAGKFLEFFTDKHPNWAHLDIAGTAFMKTAFSKGTSATAYGVRLLRAFVEAY